MQIKKSGPIIIESVGIQRDLEIILSVANSNI